MRTKIALLSFVLILAASSLLLAQPKQDGVCASDVKKFCANITPGNDAIMSCLFRNKENLTKECREVTIKHRQHVHEKREECRPDAEKFCQGIKHGDGRIQECLEKHLSELSSTCKTNVDSVMKRKSTSDNPR